jgi:hypothetical protein
MKKNHLIYVLFLAVFVISLSSCDNLFNCLDGNGHLSSEYRVVAEFYGVENNTEYSVKITYDSVYSVRVDADENLLESINTAVRGDNLVIESDRDRCVNTNKDIIIDIHMPELDNIELTGSGNIDAYDFNCSRLEVTNTGSGDIDIRNLVANTVNFVVSGSGSITANGKAEKANYLLSGSGEIYANDIKVNECYVTSSGSGDIYCYVIDKLNVTLSGSGDVIYSGSPVITKTDSGSGDIFKRE